MMLENNQTSIAEDYGMLPFDLSVLEPIRTICEKIMSLVRFSHSDRPIEDLKNKIRHTYDLHQLLRQDEYSDFLDSPAFDDMLLKVASDDIVSFRNNNKWLAYHPSKSLLFRDPEAIWDEMKFVYSGAFRTLVYGELPEESAVLGTLRRIQERLLKVSWSIKP